MGGQAVHAPSSSDHVIRASQGEVQAVAPPPTDQGLQVANPEGGQGAVSVNLHPTAHATVLPTARDDPPTSDRVGAPFHHVTWPAGYWLSDGCSQTPLWTPVDPHQCPGCHHQKVAPATGGCTRMTPCPRQHPCRQDGAGLRRAARGWAARGWVAVPQNHSLHLLQ